MSESEQKQPEAALKQKPVNANPNAGTPSNLTVSYPETEYPADSAQALTAVDRSPIPADGEQAGKLPTVATVSEPRSIEVEAENVQSQGLEGERTAAETESDADTALADAAVLAVLRRRTRRSFLVSGAAASAAYMFYRYLGLDHRAEMQPPLLRDSYQLNASISRSLFRDKEFAPTYPVARAENLRVNGIFGLRMDLELESWRLQLVGMREATQHPRYVKDVTAWEYRYVAPPSNQDIGHDTKVDPNIATAKKMAPESMQRQAEEHENQTGRMPRGIEEAGESYSTLSRKTPGLLLHMADIAQLPRHELVTQFKCVEGWSQIVHWAGFRMADFLDLYPPEKISGNDPKYVYLETPDGNYYTGHHLDEMRHPQTLLVTEMMGAPLTQVHGAPLRLHMPTKLGYKQIKRIGLIAYTNDMPDDYWTKLGYDWYAGL